MSKPVHLLVVEGCPVSGRDLKNGPLFSIIHSMFGALLSWSCSRGAASRAASRPTSSLRLRVRSASCRSSPGDRSICLYFSAYSEEFVIKYSPSSIRINSRTSTTRLPGPRHLHHHCCFPLSSLSLSCGRRQLGAQCPLQPQAAPVFFSHRQSAQFSHLSLGSAPRLRRLR